MNKKDRALQAIEALKKLYPDAVCSLRSDNPLQLLIATRLSAQCTDARVNLVTPALFAQFPTLEAFAEATPEQVGEYIHSCGLYKTKARDIVAMCTMLRDTYGGAIPNTVEELIKKADIALYAAKSPTWSAAMYTESPPWSRIPIVSASAAGLA